MKEISSDDAIGRIDALVWLLYDKGIVRTTDLLTAALTPALLLLRETGVPNRADLCSWLPEQATYTLILEAQDKAYKRMRKELYG